MDDTRWARFCGLIAAVECMRSAMAAREHVAKHVKSAHMAWMLTDRIPGGVSWDAVDAADPRFALGHALAEIERLRERLRAEQDDCAEAESALADAGIARCEGEGCGRYVRMALTRNGMCDDCANTEDEIKSIFGNQRAEDEEGYNEIVRAGLRWSR